MNIKRSEIKDVSYREDPASNIPYHTAANISTSNAANKHGEAYDLKTMA